MSSRKTGNRCLRRLEADDVLSGRVVPTAHELVRLIHRVSPTGECVGAQEKARRYDAKARLQSLLIRRFGEGLTVERTDPDQPDLVSLKLRNYDDDACHALLGTLDAEARSWAQWRLDAPPEPQGAKAGSSSPPQQRPRAPQQAGPASVSDGSEDDSMDELLEAGRRALEEYNYEACERHLTRAFSLSKGRTRAAEALLRFLVDNLAAYEKAVSLAPQLSAEARREEEVRVLSALAAAHTGRLDQALEEARRSAHPRVAEVLLAAARHCLRADEPDRASEILELLSARDAGELRREVDALAQELTARKARRLGPLEEEMARLWSQGESQAAMEIAGRLLAEWPENRAAHRLVREVHRRQRQAEIDELVGQAGVARAEADFSREVSRRPSGPSDGRRAWRRRGSAPGRGNFCERPKTAWRPGT